MASSQSFDHVYVPRLVGFKLATSIAMILAWSPLVFGADVFETIDERQTEYEKALSDGKQLLLKAYAEEFLVV